jgi:hypothetical protein
MDDGDVGAAVVGEQPLDVDAVVAVVRERAAEEADGCGGAFVGQHFGVGEAAVVVDGDVHELPAGFASHAPGGVGVAAGVVLLLAVAPAFAGASLDPAELLDVDVHELARP